MPTYLILAIALLDAIGAGLIEPILPGLLRSFVGPHDNVGAHFGTLLSLYALAQLLCAPVLGRLSDRYGRRPVLLASLFGAVVDYVLMTLAPNLTWLYVGRALAGATAANMPVLAAYLADTTDDKVRVTRFGQLGAAISIGMIAGPAIGGVLGGMHLRAPFLAAAVMAAVNLLLTFFMLPESRVGGASQKRAARGSVLASIRQLYRSPGFLSLVGLIVAVAVAVQIPVVLWVIYGQDRFGWTPVVVGLSVAVFAICQLIMQTVAVGPVVERLGEPRALTTSLATFGAGLLLVGMASSYWLPFLALPLLAAGAIAGPILQAMISRLVKPDRQGELRGVLASLTSLIAVGGPFAVTAIYGATRQTTPGLVWALAAAVMLVLPALSLAPLRSVPEPA
ncbi:MAG: TCR/Tet family MFS transporter [Burkholderiales bacterium]|nr:TCR/Tet family MFS transporter [Burkholderiales bacterium]